MDLTAPLDGYSRRVLAWRVSNTLETEACVEARKRLSCAMGGPTIFNTDQGAEDTREVAFTTTLNDRGGPIDGKGH